MPVAELLYKTSHALKGGKMVFSKGFLFLNDEMLKQAAEKKMSR